MKAEELFKKGYNCSQSVFCAYCEKFGIDFETGLSLTSTLGGGMGRMREVCGAVSAMFLLLGMIEKKDTLNDEEKQKLYGEVQEMAEKFKKRFGSILCRDLLAVKDETITPQPTKRTPAFYHDRRCCEFINFVSDMIEEKLK